MQRIQAPQTLILNLLFLINADALDYTSRPSNYADDRQIISSNYTTRNKTYASTTNTMAMPIALECTPHHTVPHHTTRHELFITFQILVSQHKSKDKKTIRLLTLFFLLETRIPNDIKESHQQTSIFQKSLFRYLFLHQHIHDVMFMFCLNFAMDYIHVGTMRCMPIPYHSPVHYGTIHRQLNELEYTLRDKLQHSSIVWNVNLLHAHNPILPTTWLYKIVLLQHIMNSGRFFWSDMLSAPLQIGM